MAYIKVENLKYRYPNTKKLALDDLNFEIEKGAMYVYFDINFNQAVDKTEKYDEMSELVIRGDKNGVT